MIRFLLLAFNVAVVTYLVFEMINISRQEMPRSRKTAIIIGGVILLLAPVMIFLRFVPATLLYLFIYPVAIALFVYLTKRV